MSEMLRYSLKGTTPLMMHNGQLANPFYEWKIKLGELTKKKNKTEDDFLAIMWFEWRGGIYWDKEVGPYVPSDNVESVVNDGARHVKKGKDVLRAVVIPEKKIKLQYKGPRDPEAMFKEPAKFVDYRSAVNPGSGSRIQRCRPIFYEWAIEFDLAFSPDVLNDTEIDRFLTDAGRLNGLMDYRPKYGQFEAKRIK